MYGLSAIDLFMGSTEDYVCRLFGILLLEHVFMVHSVGMGVCGKKSKWRWWRYISA